jgi:hypothetical protein
VQWKERHLFPDGDVSIKPSLEIGAKHVHDKTTEENIINIPLSQTTVAQHTEEPATDDTWMDICDTAQLFILIRQTDKNFSVPEKRKSWTASQHNKGYIYFWKCNISTENYNLHRKKLISVHCTATAGKNVGMNAVLQKYLNFSLLKYHYEENL